MLIVCFEVDSILCTVVETSYSFVSLTNGSWINELFVGIRLNRIRFLTLFALFKLVFYQIHGLRSCEWRFAAPALS